MRQLQETYEAARREGSGFELAIQRGIEHILLDPEFLFRVESNVDGKESVHLVTDIDLASRLSFFLWSSIPDDELLGLAENGRLRDRGVLEQQVVRMLSRFARVCPY